MEKNTLKINIKKPVDFVFMFTINPENTPKWIPSIVEEKTSEPRVKIGTVYCQGLASGKLAEYIVSSFVENKCFDLQLINRDYSCSYVYEAIPFGTLLTYSEKSAKLESPMTKKNLLTLKKLIEKSES